MTISLCMIVKNEEEVLARCLESVRGVYDELVIVDTGSTDRTKEIAARYTDFVYDFAWIDDFSAARNFAFSKGTKEYLLWLDADDVVEPKQREKLLKLKESGTKADMLFLLYKVGPLTFYRERLVRSDGDFLWSEPVHEVIAPKGHTERHEITVTHQKLRPGEPGRNLRIYEKTLAQGQALSPRGQYYMARELCDLWRYDEAAPVLRAFLDIRHGWREDCIAACVLLSTCFEAKGDQTAREMALYESFAYDVPRPEVCYRLGMLFYGKEQWVPAMFWLKLAMEVPKPTEGFVNPSFYGYLPAIGLCLCYDRQGKYEQAALYNELAGSFSPGDTAVAYNKTYFEKKLAGRADLAE